jgi:hypothetical protein
VIWGLSSPGFALLRNSLLRGAGHRAALCTDPLARNDGQRNRATSWLAMGEYGQAGPENQIWIEIETLCTAGRNNAGTNS